jgi:hypothetical protein
VFFHFVNRANIGVVEGGGGASLPLETAEGLCVLRDIVRQKLESYEPVQVNVLGLVNHTHSTGAYPFDDAVMGDGLTDHSFGLDRRGFGEQRLDWVVEYSLARGSTGQHPFDFTPEIGVLPASAIKECSAGNRLAFQCGMKERFDPVPPVRGWDHFETRL